MRPGSVDSTECVQVTIWFLSCSDDADEGIEVSLQFGILFHLQAVGRAFNYFVNIGIVESEFSKLITRHQTSCAEEIIYPAGFLALLKCVWDGHFCIYPDFG